MPEDDDRVSLDGLDPQQALEALLAVDPGAESAEIADRPGDEPSNPGSEPERR